MTHTEVVVIEMPALISTYSVAGSQRIVPELWLDWINDELSVDATSEFGIQRIVKIFEKGVKDYLNPGVWIKYAEFAVAVDAATAGSANGDVSADVPSSMHNSSAPSPREVFESKIIPIPFSCVLYQSLYNSRGFLDMPSWGQLFS